ncbi:MAG: YhdT family protein [Desulfovibrionaceae bacterium]|nr:YhdT family protein [Desulfovibrionaceae bacterium]
MTEKKLTPFSQANREALLTLGLYAIYFLWWYIFAYGLGDGDPADYTYILGFPAWFFMSCIAGYPVITFLVWIAVRFLFKDIPFSGILKDENLDSVEERGKENGHV